MFRITRYILPLIYILLFCGLWILITAKNLPEALQDLKKVFDFSFFAMVAIFWAVYFLSKRNLFDPLVKAMERRKGFVAVRRRGFEEAQRRLLETRQAFDLKLKEVRDEERAKLEAVGKELSAGRDKAIAALKADLQRDLDARHASLQAEAEQAKRDLDPEARRLAMDVVARVLNKDVA
jgi:F0F1-type ATP synthase membrane subunit b/b'